MCSEMDLNDKFFYWQVQFKVNSKTTFTLGYIKKKHAIASKYSYTTDEGNKWHRSKGLDGATRKMLKKFGYDGIHNHGKCIAVPQTYKSKWITISTS